MKPFFDSLEQLLIAQGAHPPFVNWREEAFGSDPDLILHKLPEPQQEDYCPSCLGTIELTDLVIKSVYTRSITRAFAHCTGTDPKAKIESIVRYWKENLRWNSPGYHIIVDTDGNWTYLQDFSTPSNGVLGYNTTSVHISYIGGLDEHGKSKDTRTQAQKHVMEAFFLAWRKRSPNIEIFGHRDMANKDCPCYNAKLEYQNI